MQKENKIKKQPLTLEIRELMRENAIDLVEIMIQEQYPFRLVMWNNNNWNQALPEKIMKSFPVQIVLDIKQMALEESFVDENTGEVVITTMFEGKEYQKVLEGSEIIAVLDLTGQPYILNNFKQEEIQEEYLSETWPTTKEEVVKLVTSDGCDKEAASKSFDIFMKYNPDLAKRFNVGNKNEN